MTEHDHTDDERTDDEETAQVGALVPTHIKEAAKAKCDHGELSEIIRAVVREKAYGTAAADYASVKQELDGVNIEIDERKSDIREARGDIHELERRKSRLEERLVDLADKEERH